MAVAREEYEAAKRERLASRDALDARSRFVSWLRLLPVGGVLTLLGMIVWVGLPDEAWIAVLALVLVCAALVLVHVRIHLARDRLSAAVRFHDDGLARLDGTWRARTRGERFDREDHPYADDLDVFGKASLFALADATGTRFGEEKLAAWLGGEDLGTFPEESVRRQEAVRDLSTRLRLREELAVLGSMLGETKPDPRPFTAWARMDTGREPPYPAALVWFARLLPLITLATVVLGQLGTLHSRAFLGPLIVGVLVSMTARRKTDSIVTRASSRQTGLSQYAELIGLLERETFTSPLLVAHQARLRASGLSATAELGRLGAIIGFLDARENAAFRFIVAPVFLWDLNCAVLLDTWRRRAGHAIGGWFDALGHFEALSSLANLAHDRPADAYPTFRKEPGLVAEGLGHPLIPRESCVTNDVTFPAAGTGLVITGSNMAGKSTLLRAVGLNAVLALAGAPVCARRWESGPFVLASSMRVRDSVVDGTSRFYAELKKLKRVLDVARAGGHEAPPALFLLDEILHGTNMRERLVGARAIVKDLLANGALGAVSTHDLALGELESETGGAIRNMHFEEQVTGDRMTFDYKLRRGVVTSSNALRLMKLVGLDVVD